MKHVILVNLSLALAGCTHNYAEAYLAATMPEAHRLVIDDHAVIGRRGLQLVACIESEEPAARHHTDCYVMIDWTPRSQPSSPPPARSAPPPIVHDEMPDAKGAAASDHDHTSPAPAPTPAKEK